MAISAMLATSDKPVDPFCYDPCTSSFGEAQCKSECGTKHFRFGHCLTQGGQFLCCCSP
ncbi:hypothetical protein RchiOBHm_Chr3g0451911 [Rosa chinensis]|uniref:Defensin-like domain-containing protein n=1 Tax=Rosa chinensis TaxID=74649 RepID=A0A2P6R662_ROSCH|nr:hypothetical protein RchiOBHm_Chr3g0451911 [Rosa chinensis]